MSNSFYGGRDGQPFVIKKRYKTIQEMLNDFELKTDFTEVNFGEYVIIDTEHRNNPENGRIFRRGYDYNNENRYISSWIFNADTNIFEENTQTTAKGAIYIGRIIGPSGNAPHFISLPSKLPKLDEEGKLVYNIDGTLAYEETDSDYNDVLERYKAYDTRAGNGVFGISNNHLVPGKFIVDNTIKFNDDITWQYCSVRDENEEETTAYIGFTFPYMVVEWDANSVSPYYHRDDAKYDENWEVNTPGTSNNFNNLGLVEDARTDSEKGHPFYQKWNINIPKGIHGQSIENFALAEKTGLITYDLRNFDATEEGKTTSYTLNQDYPLTWITDATLNAGKLNIKTNTGKNQIEEQLHWVKNISIDSDTGKVTYTDVDGTSTTSQLIYIKDASFSDNTGKITLTKTDGTTINCDVDMIKSMSLNSETGELSIKSTDSNKNINTTLNWIKSASLDDETKTLTIKFVNTNPITVPLKTVSNMTLKDGGNFEATFNNGETKTIGNLTDLSISCVAEASENEVDEQLKIGGLWFITEEV